MSKLYFSVWTRLLYLRERNVRANDCIMLTAFGQRSNKELDNGG